MKRMLFGVLLIALALCLCACGAPAAQDTDTQDTDTQDADTQTADSVVSDYAVELQDAQVFTDSEGNNLLFVKYTFTNNGEEATSAEVALYIQGFQDGVELEKGFVFSDDLPEDLAPLYENDWKDLQTGASIECYDCFELTSDSDVQVIVTEFLSLEDTVLAEQTYSVQ
ncbi:MAG: DUF5067 domain-containing protein [Firmicutes bacterium]|nr:DUF5067 domain-containing protein [Bacillota bacterium]